MNSNTTIKIDPTNTKHRISPYIYGHFVEHIGKCIYEGLYVGPQSKISNTAGIRNDIISLLKQIKIPVLRWPGGCFADTYHWMDGIGEPGSRPTGEIRQWGEKIKWGGSLETNQFGTHDFFNLCELLECEPYLALNVGTGSVEEAQQWLEYITADEESCLTNLRKENGRNNPWKLKFVGVGNESWGCGGAMTVDIYASEFKGYASHTYNCGKEDLYKVACGADEADYQWTETLMKEAGSQMNGLSLHNYCFTQLKSNVISNEQWMEVLSKAIFIDKLISNHSMIMDKYDPEKKIGLFFDEWGTWHEADPDTDHKQLSQHNTICDAMVAAVVLNILNNHCARVKMANIAQLVNVLHCLFKTKGESLVLTPTFHVYDMYKTHLDAKKLELEVIENTYLNPSIDLPRTSISGSINNSGIITLTVCNLDPVEPAFIHLAFSSCKIRGIVASILSADQTNAENTFETPNKVSPQSFQSYEVIKNNQIKLRVKAIAIVSLKIETY